MLSCGIRGLKSEYFMPGYSFEGFEELFTSKPVHTR